MRQTVERTTKFPVSSSLLNSVKTFLKSMGFGATKMLPPNAERCVHKQCNFPLTIFHPTFKTKIKLSKLVMRLGEDSTKQIFGTLVRGNMQMNLF